MEKMLQKARLRIALIMLGLAVSWCLISFVIAVAYKQDMVAWGINLLQNSATEALGAFMVIILIDRTLSTLQSEVEKQREKDDLIIRMSNPNDNNAALEALRFLRERGYITDGSLSGKTLHWAKLQKANLQEADLREPNLGGVDFTEATLWYANLQGATLGTAKLVKTNLGGAKLQGASLRDAKMTGAILDANTVFDENTTLPDGSNWTPETDMSKFTKGQARGSTGSTRWA